MAVRPERQHAGVGSALVRAGLARLRLAGARGAVLVGDPAYYAGFGFRPRSGLTAQGVPDAYVQGLAFVGETPEGEVRFHPAFGQG